MGIGLGVSWGVGAGVSSGDGARVSGGVSVGMPALFMCVQGHCQIKKNNIQEQSNT